MSRRAQKPWKWKGRRNYYVIFDGKRHNLGPDREEAYRRFRELQANGKRKPTPGSSSVVAVIDEFLDACNNDENLAPSTYEWYRQRLQLFVETIPRDLSLRDFEQRHVQDWIDKYRHLSSGTRRNYCRAIQRAMNWAAEKGCVNASPLRYFRKPPGGKREVVIAAIRHEAILGYSRDREFQDLLQTAWEIGPRPQEICAVEARHVDVVEGRWIFPASESKGKKRIRVVYLTDTALAVTKRLMLKYPEGNLFRNTRGNAWTPDAANCRFSRIAEKVGQKYCLYDYRHTWATRALKTA